MKLGSILAAWVLGSITISAFTASAQAQTAVPSCYAAVKAARPPRPLDLAVFVLVDQTVLLDAGLKQSLLDTSLGLLHPNSSFNVMSFSAFSQGRYLNPVAEGGREPLLDKAERNAVGSQTLSRLDRCLLGQAAFEQRRMFDAVSKSEDGASSSLARSDILATFHDIAHVVAESGARRKVVLVASDMLENSAITSFYEHDRLRSIDPAREFAKARRAGMIGDFGNAEVYVIGAGLMGDSGTQYRADAGTSSYRNPLAMDALKRFWNAYFTASRAQLVEFGAPALLRPVS
jgi:hypothetical protein